MNIHRIIAVLVGMGMLLLLGILVISLINVMAADDRLIRDEENRAREIRRIETIMNELGNMSLSSHQYLANNKDLHRQAYFSSRDIIDKILDTILNQNLHTHDRQLATAVRLTVEQTDEPARQLFTLSSPPGRNRTQAYELAIKIDGLLTGIEQRIQAFISDERAEQMINRVAHLRIVGKRNVILFLLTLLLSIGFLLGYGISIRRKLALTLSQSPENAPAGYPHLSSPIDGHRPGSPPGHAVHTGPLDAMEQFKSEMRHQINNPLSTIIGNAELLMDRPRDAGQDHEFTMRLEAILNNALRIADIVKHTKDGGNDAVPEKERDTRA